MMTREILLEIARRTSLIDTPVLVESVGETTRCWSSDSDKTLFVDGTFGADPALVGRWVIPSPALLLSILQTYPEDVVIEPIRHTSPTGEVTLGGVVFRSANRETIYRMASDKLVPVTQFKAHVQHDVTLAPDEGAFDDLARALKMFKTTSFEVVVSDQTVRAKVSGGETAHGETLRLGTTDFEGATKMSFVSNGYAIAHKAGIETASLWSKGVMTTTSGRVRYHLRAKA